MINTPVFRHEVKAKESLKSPSILKFAQGTNFPFTDDEWVVIAGLSPVERKRRDESTCDLMYKKRYQKIQGLITYRKAK